MGTNAASSPLALGKSLFMPPRILRVLLGPVLTLLLASVLLALRTHGLHVPNPVLFFACLIVLSSFLGGTLSGMACTAITCAFALVYWSQPEQLLQYTELDVKRLLVLGLTMPPLALLTGRLHDRARLQRRQMEALNQRQARDLDEQRQLAARLRESEERFRSAFEHAAIGMGELAPSGRWLRANPSLCALLGYTAEELTQRTFSDITHPDDITENLELLDRLLSGEQRSVYIDKRYQTKAGETAWVGVTATLVRDAEGKPLHFVSQVQDMTAQRTAELKVRELNASLVALLESTSDLIWSVDARRFGLELFNTGMRKHYAGSGIELQPGMTPAELMSEDQARHWQALYANILIHGSHEIQQRCTRTNRIYSISLHPVRRDGEAISISAFGRDITTQRESVSAIIAAKERAEAASKAKQEFLANMSHELRTPLNGVLGMFALLEESSLSPEQLEFARMGKQAGGRLLTLLNDVLDFTRLEAGQVALRRESFSPAELLRSVAEAFSLRCHERSLTLELCEDPTLPPHLLGDEQRIRQVLFNLMGNAVKYTPQGTVRLSAWARPSQSRAGVVHAYFCVEDSGPGIDDTKMEHLFQRFTQSDASLTRQHQGAGLGLAIVRRSTELLGGSLEVASEPGKGTAFTLHLPLARVEADEDAPGAIH